jgi:hypothetical protein
VYVFVRTLLCTYRSKYVCTLYPQAIYKYCAAVRENKSGESTVNMFNCSAATWRITKNELEVKVENYEDCGLRI